MKRGYSTRLLRSLGVGGVAIGGILSILGSGGGGDGVPTQGAEQTPSIIKALNFDADTGMGAAQSTAAVMAFFPHFTTIERMVMTTLAATNPANSPFDIPMCGTIGHATLTWIDADHSGDLSLGDSASLQLIGCDFDGRGTTASGTVKLGLTSVASGPTLHNISHNVSINLTVTGNPDTTVYSASFAALSSSQDDTTFTNTYTAYDSTKQVLTVTRNGGTPFQFGCFKVTQSFSVADGTGTYRLSPSGVINTAGAIMSLANGASLSFVDSTVEAGTQRLLSASIPHCAALGVGDGVDGSDGSYLDIQALGGGNLRLHTFNASNIEFVTTDTTWKALLN